MENTKEKTQRSQDEEDLRLIRKIKKYADEGYDVEVRKAKGGGYKTMRYKKQLITADQIGNLEQPSGLLNMKNMFGSPDFLSKNGSTGMKSLVTFDARDY